MSDAVFPVIPGLRWGRQKKPIWETTVKKAASGHETRTTYWSYPIWRFSLPVEFLRSKVGAAEIDTLGGFFNARCGKWDSFLWDNRDDFAATDQAFGTGTAATTTFTLLRAWGGAVEPVMWPINITAIKINGIPTGLYSHIGKGRIVFNSAPANGAALTWSGQYRYRARFENDDGLDFEQLTGGQHWKSSNITMLACLGDKI